MFALLFLESHQLYFLDILCYKPPTRATLEQFRVSTGSSAFVKNSTSCVALFPSMILHVMGVELPYGAIGRQEQYA